MLWRILLLPQPTGEEDEMTTYLIYAPLIGWANAPVCLRGVKAASAEDALIAARKELGAGVIYAGGRRFDGDNLAAVAS